jgi:hypothetical protein
MIEAINQPVIHTVASTIELRLTDKPQTKPRIDWLEIDNMADQKRRAAQGSRGAICRTVIQEGMQYTTVWAAMTPSN